MDYRDFDKQITYYGEKPKAEDVLVYGEFGGDKNNQDSVSVVFVSETNIEPVRCFCSEETTQFFNESVQESGISSWYTTPAIKKNVCTEDEMHMILRLEIEILNPKLVVALGRRSEKMLLKVKDIYHHLRWFDVLPHPDFWLRFYSHAKNEYKHLLCGIQQKVDHKTNSKS